MSKSAKEEFCRSFEWKIDIKWMDCTGLVRLDENRIAKIVPARTRTAEHYDGFTVYIIHKQKGNVDGKRFAFDDYLNTDMSGRKDGRDEHPLGKNTCFEVISYVGWKWYIAVPKTTRPLCEEIEKYIEIFR